MAFESVNVGSLRNALNQCKNNLNYNTTNELKSSIANNDVWSTVSRDKLNQAFDKLTGIRYKEIEEKIEVYHVVTDLIERYKFLEEENRRMRAEIEALLPHLYYTVTHTDSEGNSYTVTYKDYAVEARINELKALIAKNEAEMREIVNQVDGLV